MSPIPKKSRRKRTEFENGIKKIVEARSIEGKFHKAVDLVDTMKPDPFRDAATHFAVTMALGKGPLVNRAIRAGKGVFRYTVPRVIRTPKPRKRTRMKKRRSREFLTATEAGFYHVS